MRELSFKGFLEQYVRGLSRDQSGLHLRRLAREAETPAGRRLLVPLVLLALVTDRLHLLDGEASPDGCLDTELARVRRLGAGAVVGALGTPDWSGEGPLPVEYYKARRAYVSARDRFDETAAKEALRCRALERQAASGTTTYRAAADLSLNEGALWDFLARGNLAALTRDDARRVAEYMGL